MKSNMKNSFLILFACLLFSQIGFAQFEIPEIPKEQTSVYDYANILNVTDTGTTVYNSPDREIVTQALSNKVAGITTGPQLGFGAKPNEGDGILELVKRAGGYTKNAYPFGGILENESTKKVNE